MRECCWGVRVCRATHKEGARCPWSHTVSGIDCVMAEERMRGSHARASRRRNFASPRARCVLRVVRATSKAAGEAAAMRLPAIHTHLLSNASAEEAALCDSNGKCKTLGRYRTLVNMTSSSFSSCITSNQHIIPSIQSITTQHPATSLKTIVDCAAKVRHRSHLDTTTFQAIMSERDSSGSKPESPLSMAAGAFPYLPLRRFGADSTQELPPSLHR